MPARGSLTVVTGDEDDRLVPDTFPFCLLDELAQVNILLLDRLQIRRALPPDIVLVRRARWGITAGGASEPGVLHVDQHERGLHLMQEMRRPIERPVVTSFVAGPQHQCAARLGCVMEAHVERAIADLIHYVGREFEREERLLYIALIART